MIVIVLPMFFVSTWASGLCPDHIHMSLRQENLVPRPKGEVDMTCAITGVSSSQVEFYMWVIEETNSPIYQYSERHAFDGIKPANAYLVKGVSHTLSETGIESHLTLILNVTNKNTFQCDFKIIPDILCRKVIGIKFQEPRVSINFTHNPIQERNTVNATLVSAACHVDVTAGAPAFNVSYNGTERNTFQVVKQKRKLGSYDYYKNGSYLTTLMIPYSGEIICTVTDTLGKYIARKPIHITVMPDPSSSTVSTPVVVSVTVVVSLVLVVTAVVAMVYVQKKKKTKPEIQPDDECVPLLQAKEEEIFKRYFKSEWKMKTITDISTKPMLYAGEGPSVEDVQQTVDAADDGWFLAALRSLCLAFEQGKWKQFHKIFEHATDLKAQTITIQLWRYGQWEKIDVQNEFPTKNGKLCFTHSRNKDVFWSALLQRAFATIYVDVKHLVGERDVHVLEDLTGGIVNKLQTKHYQKEHRKLWVILGKWGKEAICLTCKALTKENRVNFFSVTGINEDAGELFLHRIVDGNMDEAEKTLTLSSDKLAERLVEIDMLFKPTNTIAASQQQLLHNTWKQTDVIQDYEKDKFWTNPQYLLKFDQSNTEKGSETQICVGVMVKYRSKHEDMKTTRLARYRNKSDSSDEDMIDPLKVGVNIFRVTSRAEVPDQALEHYREDIRDSWSTGQRFTREVCRWWRAPTVDRYVVVPTASGGTAPADFMIRTFSQKPVEFRELPRGTEKRKGNIP